MSIYGKIKNFRVVTLEDDISSMTTEDKGCEGYIKTKHKTAEENSRYIVRFEVEDPRFKDKLSPVSVFVPKGIIDNNLLEKETEIECSSTSCHLSIIGIDDWFDRACNGDTQIHDTRFKK